MKIPSKKWLLVLLLMLIVVPTTTAQEQEPWPYIIGTHYADPQNESGDAAWKIKVGQQHAPAEIEVFVYGTNPEIDGLYRVPLAEYLDGYAIYRMAYTLFESSSIWLVRARVHPDVSGDVEFVAIESPSVPYSPPEGLQILEIEPQKLGDADVEEEECLFILTSKGQSLEFPLGVYSFVMREPSEDDGLPYQSEYREFFWFPLSKIAGKSGHYSWDPFPYYLGDIEGAWTVVEESFRGQFNVSHCPQQALAAHLVIPEGSNGVQILTAERVDTLWKIESFLLSLVDW